MIVGDYNGTKHIYENITTTRVSDAIRLSSHDVGTLCTYPGINPWAKYKPVNDPHTVLARDTTNTVRWKGENEKCGFLIGKKVGDHVVTVTRIDDLVNADWYYEPVHADKPKRLADFGGYNSNASPAFWTGIEGNLSVNKLVEKEYKVLLELNDANDPTELTLQEVGLRNLANYHLAMATRKHNNGLELEPWNININGDYTILNIKTNPDTEDHLKYENGTTISTNISHFNTEGNGYDIMLYLTTASSPENAGELMPLPSGHNSLTKYVLTVKNEAVYSLIFYQITKKLGSTADKTLWYNMSDYPYIDSDQEDFNPLENAFMTGPQGRLYLKGLITRENPGYQPDFECNQLNGVSERFNINNDNPELTRNLGGRILDGQQRQIDFIEIPTNVGESKEIILKWDYLDDASEPLPKVINGLIYIYQGNMYQHQEVSVGFCDSDFAVRC